MESDNKTPKWLGRLQQESWNLELLISGFSIFLLFQGLGVIESQGGQLSVHSGAEIYGKVMLLLLGICYMGCFILIFNLILHILLRGFWIGTIGLSSVKNKRDFSTLRYTEKFTNRLNEKVAPLEGLIVRLDNLCSVIFAFTFLIVFMLVSLFSTLIFLTILIGILSKLEVWFFPEHEEVIEVIQFTIFLMFSFTGFLYFIDTLTLGGLKKIKWLQKIYYPTYRFFNFISFSSVYNSLYYHLLTRFPKRYIILAIVFYVGVFFMNPFFTYNLYSFYPDNETKSELFTNTYDNQRSFEEEIGNISIPSLIIKDQFLPVFIRYDNSHNEVILKNCSDYEPSKKSGFISGIRISKDGFLIGDPTIEEADPEKLLNCLQQHYQLYLNDSLYHQSDFYFFEQNNQIKEKGLKTILDISYLSRGKHILKITRKDFDHEDISIEKNYATIPFWKE